MKKFLLTAALVLALVTSLTAGTMAFYSTEIATISDSITTKEFEITADKRSDSYIAKDLEIAPGDSITYHVNVTNGSEVSADTLFNAKLVTASNEAVTFPGMNVVVTKKVGGSVDNTTTETSTTVGTTSYVKAYMRADTVDAYEVTVTWPFGETGYGQIDTDAYDSETFYLKMDISGQQSADEGIAYNGESGIGTPIVD